MSVRPADFPPPFGPAEFVAEPTDPPDERIDVGVLVVGTLSYAVPDAFPDKTVWSHFGSGYGFVPLVLPVLGIWWLNRVRAVSPSRTSPRG